MKNAILICFFLLLLYGSGHGVRASLDNGGSLDYVPPAQNLGIHTMTVPEALTLNGSFALQDQAGDPGSLAGYGKLYSKAGDLYFQNGSSIFWITNGNPAAASIAADSLDFSEFKDTMSLDASTNITMTNGDLNFDVNTFVIDSSADSVGIGIVAPQTNLHIQESNSNTTPAFELEQLSTGDAAMQFSISGDSYAVGIDNTNDYFKISYASTAGTAVLGINDRLTIDSSGNVGIGDSSPDAPLDVVGDLYVTDGLSLYETAVSDGTVEATKFCTGDGESNCLTDFSALSAGASVLNDLSDAIAGTTAFKPLFIGTGAGASSSPSNSNFSVGICYYALNANDANDTYNTALGYEALMNNDADYNTAVGAYALATTTTGGYNIAIGANALRDNTTGIRNTAVGMSALE